MNEQTLITGFPRIGEKRELKKALESYWSGKSSLDELQAVSFSLRSKHWQTQTNIGIDLIACNDFSWYDGMLDTAVMVNAIPDRFQTISDVSERYFAMARGSDTTTAMEMTKWFNTNYHYIVPELNKNTSFSLDASKIINEYKEADLLGFNPKINLIGPLTFLGLAKSEHKADCYSYFDRLLPVYEDLIQAISSLNETVYVQFDEPIFARDPTPLQLDLLATAYERLGSVSSNVKLIVTTYFDHSTEATAILASKPIWGIGLDFIYGKENINSLHLLGDKKLIAGVVDGRNIWLNNLEQSLTLLEGISKSIRKSQIIISPSCSLLHVPYTLRNEPDTEIKEWLAFSVEKVKEVALLSRLFHSDEILVEDESLLNKNRKSIKKRQLSSLINNQEIQRKVREIKKTERTGDSVTRKKSQIKYLNLPDLPTTTIGSYPQTPDIRKLRNNFKKGHINKKYYEDGIKKYIDDCVAFQEKIGLDILVHGEPERNDMVEYFGEMLKGFHFTQKGWVQSYGSRCVKPPIIYGDISRPESMTVKWITYAQKQTPKPMKGMLTGPVTILNWSFVRDDKPRFEVSTQIALALSEEIEDLQEAGIKIIQVDEAAFKEGYPLRKENIPIYENWAVKSFKLAVSKAAVETQIHTHMCYSNFNDIIGTIESMDADVITIETARSGNTLLNIFKKSGYKNQVGPGVYDIHSPRIPSVEEFTKQIHSRLEVLPIEQIWINPDCGLKTRKWEEVKPALTNMVKSVLKIRSSQMNS